MGKKDAQNRFPPTWMSVILIALITAITYGNIYDNSFVFDDTRSIADNPAIRNPDSLLSFKQPSIPRILVNLTYSLNYRFGKLEVFGYHLVNVIIHILNGILVYFLSRLLFKKLTSFSQPETSIYSLFSALIFVCHPVQTQAVTYTVQRYTSMAAMFYLSSVFFYLKARLVSPPRTTPLFFITLSVVSGILAFLCKESTASLPVAILLAEFMLGSRSWPAWKKKLPWFAVTLMLWTLYILFVSGFFSSERTGGNLLEDVSDFMYETHGISRWNYLCTQFNAITIYIRLLFLPIRQNADYMYPFKTGFFDGCTPLACLFLTGIAGLGIWFRNKRSLIAFAIGWFFIALSVESSVIPISDALFEHRLYLPLLGFALLVPYLCRLLFRHRQACSFVLTIIIIISLGITAHRRNKVWQDDVTFWSDAVSKNQQNYRALNSLGFALSKHGQLDEAIELYNRSLLINPHYAEAHVNLGIARSTRKQYGDAISHFTESLRLKPNYVLAKNNLGHVLFTQGKREEAIEQYRDALAIQPEFAEVHYNLGIALAGSENLDEAIEHYREALRIKPDYADSLHNLGVALTRQGKVGESIPLLQESLNLTPGSAGIWNSLGVAYYTSGQTQKAIESYSQAIRLDPAHHRSHNNIGVIFHGMGKTDMAIASFTKAIEIKPEFADVHNSLGIIYFDRGNMNEAIASFKKAIESRSDFTEAHTRLGMVYHRSGNLEDALKSLEKAAGFEPGNPEIHKNLGVIYHGLGRWENAIESFKSAVKIKPDQAEIHNLLGIALFAGNRRDQAVESFQKAIQLKPDSHEAYNSLGVAYTTMGNQEKALDLFENALKLNPLSAQAHYNLAKVLSQMNRQEEAIPSLKQAIAINPSYAKAHYLLSSCYVLIKQYDPAIKHADQARKLGYGIDREFLNQLEPHRK